MTIRLASHPSGIRATYRCTPSFFVRSVVRRCPVAQAGVVALWVGRNHSDIAGDDDAGDSTPTGRKEMSLISKGESLILRKEFEFTAAAWISRGSMARLERRLKRRRTQRGSGGRRF